MTRRSSTRLFALAATASLIFIAAVLPARGQGLTLTDGDAVFNFGAFPTQPTAGAGLADFRPDNSQDFLFSHGWHYRRGTDTREYALCNPTIVQPYSNQAQLVFDQGDFIWTITPTLTDGPVANWADLYVRWDIESTSSQAIDLRLIDYADMDVLWNSDSAHRIPDLFGPLFTHGIQVSHGNLVANYRAMQNAGQYRVATYNAVQAQLTDGAITSFDNSGLPFGPGDFTGALSFANTLLPAPSGQWMTSRSIEIRPIETLAWNSDFVNGSFTEASFWTGTVGDDWRVPRNWRIVNLNNNNRELKPLLTASLASGASAVVREMNINTGDHLGNMNVEVYDSAALCVVTTTRIGHLGVLGVHGGTFYTSSLLVEPDGQLQHTAGQIIIDGGTFDPVSDDPYVLDSDSASHVAVLTLQNGATVAAQYANIGVWNRGRMEILGGSRVDLTGPSGQVYIAPFLDSQGELIVQGPESRLITTLGLTVANYGNAALRIRDGALVSDTSAFIEPVANGVGSTGLIEVSGQAPDGTPSTWTTHGALIVGHAGIATMTISGGGVVNALNSARIGQAASAAGSTVGVTGNNSIWNVTGDLVVGGHNSPGGAAMLHVSDSAQVVASDIKVWQPGTVQLDAAIISTHTLELAGGNLQGDGVILLSENLINTGIVSPGIGPDAGYITISGGGYVQTEDGRLDIELGGLAYSQHDVLNIIAGSASFDGTLNISLINAFMPEPGDSFKIVEYASYGGGGFAAILGRHLGGGLFLEPIYYDDAVWLDAIQARPGDTDMDFDVDLSDLGNLATYYGRSSDEIDWIHGDFDHDNDVDLNDLGTLATYYGAGSAQAFTDFQMLTSVPEPATPGLFAFSAAAALQRRRRPPHC